MRGFVETSLGSTRRRETLERSLVGLGGLDIAILRGSGGDEILQKVMSDVGDLVYGPLEGLGVHLCGFRGSADLAHVLERSGVHLFVVGGGLEIVEDVDVSAHAKNVTLAA